MASETINISVNGIDEIQRAERALNNIEQVVNNPQELQLRINEQTTRGLGVIEGALVRIVATTAAVAAINKAVINGYISFTPVATKVLDVWTRSGRAIQKANNAGLINERVFERLISVWSTLGVGIALGIKGFLRGILVLQPLSQRIDQVTNQVLRLATSLGGILRGGISSTIWAAEGLATTMPIVGRTIANVSKEALAAAGGFTGLIGKALAGKAVFAALGLAFAAVSAASAGIVAIFAGLAKRVEEFTVSARRLNVTIEEFQGLKFAAEQAGSSIQTLTFALRSVDQDKLSALGVSGSGTERINQLADAFANLSSNEERAALAADLFGRQGADLIPLLEGGRLGLKQWNEEFQSTGNLITNEGAEGFRQLNDEFNRVKNTIIGFVNTIAQEALPLISAGVNNFLIALEPVKGVIQGLTFVTKEYVRVAQVFGTIGRQTAEDIYTLGLQAGFSKEQVDSLKDSFGRGFIPALVEYVSVGGSWAALQERQHDNEQDLTRALLENAVAMQKQHEGQRQAISSTNTHIDAAREYIKQTSVAGQAQAQARLQTIAWTGAIEAGIITKNNDIQTNNALAESIGRVTIASRQAALRGAGLAFATGNIEGTLQSAPGVHIPSVSSSSSSAGGSSSGIGGTLEEAIARSIGRVVTSDLPISMEEAINAATLDWNMQQTNEGTLALLRQGETNFAALLDGERDRRDREEEREKEKKEALDEWWKVQDQVEKNKRKNAEEQLAELRKQTDAILDQRSAFTQSFAATGASNESLTSALGGVGYTGKNNVLINALVDQFVKSGGSNLGGGFGDALGYRIELDGEVLGQFVVRNVVTGTETGTFTFGGD